MKKGFTLVEVIAVIALVAAVALISTFTIVQISQDAGKGNFSNNVRSLIQAAETMVIQGTYVAPITFTFSESGVEPEIEIGGGNFPTSGKLVLLKDGSAVANQLSDGAFCISGVDTEEFTVLPHGQCEDVSSLYE